LAGSRAVIHTADDRIEGGVASMSTGSPISVQEQHDTRAERFTWERIVQGIRWRGVIGPGGKLLVGPNAATLNRNAAGKVTRGAVSPQAVRAIAFVLAGHADQDGSRVMPGDKRLAVLAECDEKQVKDVRTAFVALGLLALVSAGNRRAGGGNCYRLAIPVGLLDGPLVYLGPEEVRGEIEALRGAERARRDAYNEKRRTGSDGPVTETDVPGPMDPVHTEAPESRTGSDGPPELSRTGSDGPREPGPLDRRTTHDHPPTPTTQMADVRTDVAVPREAAAAEDPISEVGETSADDRRRQPGESIAEWAARIAGTTPPPPPGDPEADHARRFVQRRRQAEAEWAGDGPAADVVHLADRTRRTA
ncbi:hypothetical protein ACGFKZ_30055, partial [Micromonospora tulbaghiae]|uniref:hypothetical protein n=1 Tax=Micromonospora tulbaghiae TaxID=479978 RepID=UPI00372433E0